MNHSSPRYTNEHLANERTFLAWIRTAIAIMAFGFVVVKFSIFVRQISVALSDEFRVLPTRGYSPYIGIALVATGGIILILAFLQFKRVRKQIETNAYQSSSGMMLSLTVFIGLLSIALIAYLFTSI